MRYLHLLFFTFFVSLQGISQSIDSIKPLSEISVKGFSRNKSVLWVPASVQSINADVLHQLSNSTLVSAVNTLPGIRMEERSPGSYRLSIRGSLLRSPFGIRNIKIYWKDLPLTDAGGNSYLNLIDNNALGKMEILKGPAGSIYGAGTGGVVTVEENAKSKQPLSVALSMTGGSFGLFNSSVKMEQNTDKGYTQILQSNTQSDGYRLNTVMKRQMSMVNGTKKTGDHNELSGLLWYSKINYRTPGGLTLAQMQADPRQARPATSTLPSAVQQQAGIENTTVFAGITNTHTFSPHWENATSVVFSNTRFDNPFITNYESRSENNVGFRSRFSYHLILPHTEWHWISGVEWQKGFYRIDSTGNASGFSDNNKVSDDITAKQQFLFSQVEVQIHKKWLFHTGISLNSFNNHLQRKIPLGQLASLRFNPQWLPKFSILYALKNNVSWFVSASKGYSAPSIAEIRPSAGGIYLNLQAEQGWNIESGIKLSVAKPAIQMEWNVFQYTLNNAIVRRTNAAGAEYFINAGGTTQKGMEILLRSWLINHPIGIIQQLKSSVAFTWYDFKFSNYIVNTTNYSGKQLTGVPNKVLVAGIDIQFSKGFYEHTGFNYTGSLPLTDLNDVFAEAYTVWQAALGWKTSCKKSLLDFFLGVDNIGNTAYSLGNDLNAVGKRYYNPAATRNYFAGFRLNR